MRKPTKNRNIKNRTTRKLAHPKTPIQNTSRRCFTSTNKYNKRKNKPKLAKITKQREVAKCKSKEKKTTVKTGRKRRETFQIHRRIYLFFSSIWYKKKLYQVGDFILLESDKNPHKIGRIIAIFVHKNIKYRTSITVLKLYY